MTQPKFTGYFRTYFSECRSCYQSRSFWVVVIPWSRFISYKGLRRFDRTYSRHSIRRNTTTLSSGKPFFFMFYDYSNNILINIALYDIRGYTWRHAKQVQHLGSLHYFCACCWPLYQASMFRFKNEDTVWKPAFLWQVMFHILTRRQVERMKTRSAISLISYFLDIHLSGSGLGW